MANYTLTPTAAVAITGIVPAAGPTSTDRVNGSYAPLPALTIDDRVANTFTVNAGTTAVALNLDKIIAGKYAWLECDGPLHVTLTQDLGSGPVDSVIKVDKFFLLQSSFTAVKIANTSSTTAVHLSVIIGGDRAAIGDGPGVF